MPKDGKIQRIPSAPKASKLFLPLIGLASLAWFLIRVLPKPSRLAYPCMKATRTPGVRIRGVVVWTDRFGFALENAAKAFKDRPSACRPGSRSDADGIRGHDRSSPKPVYETSLAEPANQPMGIAKGIFPGRIVWDWNPDATNENTTNTRDDYWWQDKNVDIAVIEDMLSKSLRQLTGTSTDAAAWDALFRDFNKTHGKGNKGYAAGQKVAVKINLGDEWSRNMDRSTGAWRDNGSLNRIDSTPQLVLAVMRQLVNRAGVAQKDIA